MRVKDKTTVWVHRDYLGNVCLHVDLKHHPDSPVSGVVAELTIEDAKQLIAKLKEVVK